MQYEYARLAATGIPRREIARRLGVAPETVDEMVQRACLRLGVDRRDLGQALLKCNVHADKGGKRSSLGLRRGDAVKIVGGVYTGKKGHYVRAANSKQVYVSVGGAELAIRRSFIVAADQPTPTAWAEYADKPIAYLWQHKKTGATRIVTLAHVWTDTGEWQRIGPLILQPYPEFLPKKKSNEQSKQP